MKTFLAKVAQSFADFLGYFEKYHFTSKKTAVTTFGADFGLPLATLGLILIQHKPGLQRSPLFMNLYLLSLSGSPWANLFLNRLSQASFSFIFVFFKQTLQFLQ